MKAQQTEPFSEAHLIEVKTYEKSHLKDWNRVLDNSINGTFLHRREFMEYHGDRFEDASLILYNDDRPIAIFPAEREGSKVYSHRGLTYAGWILTEDLNKDQVSAIITETLGYFKNKGITELSVRMVPDFFAVGPQEDLKSVLDDLRFEVEFIAVHHCTKLPYLIRNKGKKWGRNKAKKHGLIIELSDELEHFWEKVLVPNLWERHHVVPTHSFKEIAMLKSKFPNEILFYAVKLGKEVVGGAVVFQTQNTAHLQYVGATSLGKKMKCLDYLIGYLVEERFSEKGYFNMGVSHDPLTGKINQGLVNWKKSFGGKPAEVNFYSLLTHLVKSES